MAIQVPSQQKQSNIVHIAIVAAATAAIAVAAIIPLSRSGSEPALRGRTLSPSIISSLDTRQQFAEDMVVHEALTEATFGPLAVSEASMVARAIAEHDAAFPRVAVVRDTSSELARAIAEHDAAFPPVAVARDTASELARAIAEHDALIEPFVS